MPLQSSGQISLDDIHVEAGGSTGTEASLNDTDIRGLISKADGSANSFSEYYSASGASYSVTPSATSVMEGESITVNFTAPDSDGTTIYFLVSTLSGGLGVDDFTNETGDISGVPYYEATVNNAAGSFTITTAVDNANAESENFQLQLRTGAVNGTVQATSSSITIQNPSVTISDATPNEGDTITFTISGRPNHTYAWINVAAGNYSSPSDFAMTDGSTYSALGSVTTNSSGAATVQLDVVSDTTTEGNEVYSFRIHPDNNLSQNFVDVVIYEIQDTSQSSVSITPTSTSQSEGINHRFDITGSPNTTYYFTLNHITTSPSELFFTVGSGQTYDVTTTSSGTGSFFVSTKIDGTTEGSETYQVEMRTGSTSGTVVATSSTVTISDTSTNPSLSEQPYYEMHLLNTLTGQNASWITYTHSLSSYASTNGRLVFAYQNGTTGTSYRGDIQIDNIFFTDTSSGQGYNYSFETSANITGWETSTSNSSAMSLGTADSDLRTFEDNLNTYSAVTTTQNSQNRWNRDSGGTPSSSTGLTTGDDGDYYLYAETSGSSTLGAKYTTCTPLIDLDSSPGSVSYAVARYGNNIGTLKVYWAENKSSDPYTGGSTGFSPTNVARIQRATLNGSTNSQNYFWYSNGGGYSSSSPATVYGKWPSGPSNGTTCKLILMYKSYNYWRGDFQLDDVYVNATSETAGGTDTNIDFTGINGWQKGTTRRTYTSSTAPSTSDMLTHAQNDAFTDLSTGSSVGTWNIDSSGTPSSATGLTSVGGGAYCYWEASSSGYGYSYKYVPLMSREFTIDTSNSNNGVRMKMGLYGTHFGLFRVYLIW